MKEIDQLSIHVSPAEAGAHRPAARAGLHW